ncbi:hypothetical protein MIR68_011697 [Amoeboaphelidium protococcarum]|nr:hypothetical protein MIR68_011697 [Amoeboaphelidium protococcarum]
MGKIYRKYLEQHVIGCSQCKTHLTTQDDIISRAFHGHFGRAYLVNAVVNSNRFKASETDGHRQSYNSNSASSSPGIRYQITSSPNRYTPLSAGENRRDIFSDNDDEFEAGEDRLMATGMHRVCDIACVQCGLLIGWKYIHAYEESQKYKEGKYVLECTRIIDLPYQNQYTE